MMGPPDDLTPEDFEDTDLDPLEATTPKQRFWEGSVVVMCDLCDTFIDDVSGEFVDGRTTRGHWAIMCRACHKHHGVGLGTGYGQLYTRTDGRWLKIKG